MLEAGQNPQLGFEPIRESRIESLDNFVSRMAQAAEEARAALVKAADDMAQFYDAHRCEAPKYNVGDKVWLSSENIRTACPTKKLDYKWLSPYVVEQVISPSAYQLKLPASFGKTHPIFSVTLIHPFKGDSITECQERHPLPPPPIVHDGIEEYKVERSLTAGYFVERSST